MSQFPNKKRYSAVPNIRAVCNKRTGGYFFRTSSSEQTGISKQGGKKSENYNRAGYFSTSLLYKMHEITKRTVWNKRAGWIFWRDSLSEQAKNVRAGWKIILKIVSEQGLILGTAEYVLILNQYRSFNRNWTLGLNKCLFVIVQYV